MNQRRFGITVAKLRKQHNMTQAMLAKSLNISSKAVSKWETGIGYPEITLLPKLAAVFGVSVDYLITGERRGISIAGNIDDEYGRQLIAQLQRYNTDTGGVKVLEDVPTSVTDVMSLDGGDRNFFHAGAGISTRPWKGAAAIC